MFAQISAIRVAAASTEALPVSVRMNLRSGVSADRSQAVRPENGPEAASSGALSGEDSLTGLNLQAPGVDDPAQEAAGTFVRGLAEQLPGRALLDDLPVGEEAHPAGDLAG